MTRFARVSLALLAGLFVFASVAQAAVISPVARWRVNPISMIHSCAACNGGQYAPDSSTFYMNAAATYSSALIETTQAVSLRDFQRDPRSNNIATVDSSVAIVFYVRPNPGQGTTNAADSLYVQTQLTMDGTTWVNATPTRLFYATSFTPLAAARFGKSVV